MMDERSKKEAIDAIANCTNCGDEKTLRGYVIKHSLENGWTGGVLQALDAVKELPSAQPDTRLEKIADLVDGSIDHFDLEDAMDLLYQIKDVLNG